MYLGMNGAIDTEQVWEKWVSGEEKERVGFCGSLKLGMC